MGLKDDAKCLSQLSLDKGMGLFQNVFLVYAHGDGYSPVYSSKVMSRDADKAQRKMCKNFWANVKVG